MKSFSVGEAMSFGWRMVKANLGLMIGIMIMAIIIELAPDRVGKMLFPEKTFMQYIMLIIGSLLNMIIMMGFMKICLDLCDGGQPEFADLFSCSHLILPYCLVSLIAFILVGVGLLLFIIPGILIALTLFFIGFIIVDQEVGPIEAMKKSAELTRGVKLDIFVLILVSLGYNLLGLLCLGIGILITMPITFIASAFVYRKLLMQQGQINQTSQSQFTSPQG